MDDLGLSLEVVEKQLADLPKEAVRWACEECGKKYRSLKSVERAQRHGCSKCGGVDIDLVSR